MPTVDDKYGLEPATDYGVTPAGGAAATATAEPPSDEEIEATYGKDVSPKIRAALKSGVAPMTKPTKFETESARPYMENLGAREPGTGMQPQEYLGLPNTRMIKEAAKGAYGLGKATLGGAYDVGLGEVNPETGKIEEHGLGGLVGMNTKGEIHPIDRLNALTQQLVTDPAVAEWNKGEEEGGVAGAGHKLASAIPLVGPWAAGLGERAGTGDVAGAGAELLGQVGAGAAAEKLPNVKDVTKKVAFGTPISEAGKLEAAKQQLMAVKKPSMTETEYSAKVQDSLPDLQKIAQDNVGKIRNPRDAVGAISRRIAEMEAPISEHLKGLDKPEDMVHADQYRDQVDAAIDADLAKHPGQLTPQEIEKAKADVDEFIGDQPKTLAEVEGNRKRLNQDAEDYYKSRPADKRVMDSSDAKAIAQRAAANAMRGILYGTDANPGLLEKAGVTAVDQAGNKVPLREFRRKVGNLIDVREHFEDAMVRAEQTGNWKPFENVFKGPSLAAGGAGVLAGAAAGGPFGALFGMLAGEGMKIWGDYLRSKNPNLLTQKAFENLAATTEPNTLKPVTRPVPHQYPSAIGPQTSDFAEPIGPARPPGNFQMEDLAPNREGLWQQQVGQPPPLETGAPSPGRHVEPIGPAPAAEPRLGPIQGQQLPLNLPPGPGEAPLFGIEHPAPRAGAAAPAEAPAAPPEPIGGPGREGTLGKIDLEPRKTAVEDLKVGDTFVDEKGDPRRITDITEDGTVKTADHTLRDFKSDEIDHLGEINSPRSQIARGGMFHPAEEVAERHDLGEINTEEKPGEKEEVKPMVKPGEREEVKPTATTGEVPSDEEIASEFGTPQGERTSKKLSPEKATDAIWDRIKDRSHNGEERDYQILDPGQASANNLYQTSFLLDNGSMLQGDMGIQSHMQLAREIGQDHLNDANAIRVVGPDGYEIHGMPSEAQLGEMGRIFRSLTREGRQNVHDNYVYWDFYPKIEEGEMRGYSADALHKDHVTGAGSFSDFRRAMDDYYKPAEVKIPDDLIKHPDGTGSFRRPLEAHELEVPTEAEPTKVPDSHKHLSLEMFKNLQPDEVEFLKDRPALQKNVMKEYDKIDPTIKEAVEAAKAGHGLGGWWQRFMDAFEAMGDTKTEEDVKRLGPDHAEALKATHSALSGNKSVEHANKLAWNAYRDWLDEGRPRDRESINKIITQNGKPKGVAAISDTLNKKGQVVNEGLDTTKFWKLVNSPQFRDVAPEPFHGHAFVGSPAEGVSPGAKKIPSMLATVANEGNLNRVVFDTHMKDLYGQNGLTDAKYIADSVHIRQAAKEMGISAGEAQEQMWGTVLALKQLMRKGMTPAQAAKVYGSEHLAAIGKDYAQIMLDAMDNDADFRATLDGLKKHGFDPGGPVARERLQEITKRGQARMAETPPEINRRLLAKSAKRIAGQMAAPPE